MSPQSSTPTKNHAAFLPGAKQRLAVSSSPVPTPSQDEVLVRVHATGLNYIDAGKQRTGDIMMPWVKYPFVMGCDVAGEVISVGPSSSSSFRPGDRIVGQTVNWDEKANKKAGYDITRDGGFQEYAIVRGYLACKIPDHVSFAEAGVLPLALGTAACGLFEKGMLELNMPSSAAEEKEKKKRGTLLVWGASTSVGNCAVQMAVAAGYEVVATASPRNWDMVRGLGAREVFDYRDEANVVGDVVAALKKKGDHCAGALSIGEGALAKCVDIMAQVDGNKFVSAASFDMPAGGPPVNGGLAMVPFVAKMMWMNLSMWFKKMRLGVSSKPIWAGNIFDWDGERRIYSYLEKALAEGSFKPSPPPEVVGHGLEAIQGGLDAVLKGVSGKKLVVTLVDEK